MKCGCKACKHCGECGEVGDVRRMTRRIDKILTGKFTALPLMLLMLFGVFYLTIRGANYPSELLSRGLFALEALLRKLFDAIQMPNMITDALLSGMYRTTAWVVAVMLPPMAIFSRFSRCWRTSECFRGLRLTLIRGLRAAMPAANRL